MLMAVADLVTEERPTWSGTATDLTAALGLDMKANALSMRLNVRAGRLLYEYHIQYESTRTHAGRDVYKRQGLEGLEKEWQGAHLNMGCLSVGSVKQPARKKVGCR